MKILQVFDFFSPLHGGGTVDVMTKLCNGLTQNGHKVTVCTSYFELDRGFLDTLVGINFEIDHNLFYLFGVYFTPGIRHVDVRKYDLIHFHCFRSFQHIMLS